jgi:hypothetical protein
MNYLLDKDEVNIMVKLASRQKVKVWISVSSDDSYLHDTVVCHLCNLKFSTIAQIIIHAREVHLKKYMLFI